MLRADNQKKAKGTHTAAVAVWPVIISQEGKSPENKTQSKFKDRSNNMTLEVSAMHCSRVYNVDECL